MNTQTMAVIIAVVALLMAQATRWDVRKLRLDVRELQYQDAIEVDWNKELGGWGYLGGTNAFTGSPMDVERELWIDVRDEEGGKR